MNTVRCALARSAAVLLVLAVAGSVRAVELRVAVHPSPEGDARRYRGLVEYLARRGIAVRYVDVADYRAAAERFADGSVDAMFGGSGVSCAMLIKGIAEPFVRPVFSGAAGTFSAVVVARRETAPFDGTAAWFAEKRVVFMPLAAAGEFFFRSLGPSRASAVVTAASDGAALEILARGEADAAVVKDQVWSQEKARYPRLEQVGRDDGANPEAPIVVSTRLDPAASAALYKALMALEVDASPEAIAAKQGLGIRGYVRATARDFRHTLKMVERAGVTREFAYRF